MNQQHQVRIRQRLMRPRNPLHLGRIISASSRPPRSPAVSISRSGIPPSARDSSTVSRVVPGTGVTIARSRSSNLFIESSSLHWAVQSAQSPPHAASTALAESSPPAPPAGAHPLNRPCNLRRRHNLHVIQLPRRKSIPASSSAIRCSSSPSPELLSAQSPPPSAAPPPEPAPVSAPQSGPPPPPPASGRSAPTETLVA